MTVSPASSSTMRYRSYLIRIWQSHEQGSYRASAQCVQTGNTVLFGELPQLLAFLQSEVHVTFIGDESTPPTDVAAPPPEAGAANQMVHPEAPTGAFPGSPISITRESACDNEHLLP